VFLVDSVSQWLKRNKRELNFDDGLTEGQHYYVSIVTLIKNREKFQLSNFYRHIVDRRNGKRCDTVQKLRASSTPSPSHTQATDDQENLPFSAPGVLFSSEVPASHSTALPSSLSLYGTEPSESQASSIVSFDAIGADTRW
jgi:hypothetical protein